MGNYRQAVRGIFLGPLVKDGDTIKALIIVVWNILPGSTLLCAIHQLPPLQQQHSRYCSCAFKHSNTDTHTHAHTCTRVDVYTLCRACTSTLRHPCPLSHTGTEACACTHMQMAGEMVCVYPPGVFTQIQNCSRG